MQQKNDKLYIKYIRSRSIYKNLKFNWQTRAEAKEKNIVGKEITPFLLGKIKDITGGASLEANIKLVLNNCDVAAKVAKEFYSSLHKTIT